MTARQASAISPHVFARGFVLHVPPFSKEGAGNAGRTMHPQPRVENKNNHTSVVTTGHTGITRHSPRNGFNGFLRALPGDRAFLPPSSLRSWLPRNLMPASGHQDHTTSPSASRAIRQRRQNVHRIPPRVRDDREPPLYWDGMAVVIKVIWVCCEEGIFLCRGLDRESHEPAWQARVSIQGLECQK